MAKRTLGKKIITSADFGIFPGYLLVSAGFTLAELRKELRKDKNGSAWAYALGSDEFNDGVAGLAMQRTVESFGKSKRYFYVCFRKPFTFTDEEIVALAHELVHICQFYLPDFIDRDSHIETEAYFHTHLMTQILDKFRNA